MSTLVVIDVLDPRGGVASRVRIASVPATIGRGYGNDIIIDDPYVDPTHLRIIIDESGALVAEDAGSMNGLRSSSSSDRVARVTLCNGTVLRIGRTTLRCYDPAESVTPAIPDARSLRDEKTETSGAPAWLASPERRWGVVIAVVIIELVYTYTNTVERVSAAKLITAAVAVLLALVMWSGAWALAGRLASHRASFTSHLALASAVFGAGLVVSAIGEWLAFLWPAGAVSSILILPASLALLTGLVYGQLGIVSSMGRHRRIRVSAAVIGSLLALAGVFALADQEKFSTKMNFAEQLKPVPARFVPTVSVDEFAKASRALRTAADANVMTESK
ncbi:MAG: FHA domain-containing protein [Gemmatimonadota bacterium]|nr:FHA domain-containing protein [Gemmatimonadota bacterium]